MKYEIKDSPIHGKGVFTNQSIKKGEFIDICALTAQRVTPNFGRFINHSWNPSCEIKKDYVFKVYALKDMKPGEEITVNYADTIFRKPHPSWK